MFSSLWFLLQHDDCYSTLTLWFTAVCEIRALQAKSLQMLIMFYFQVHEMMKIHQIKEEPSEEIDASSGVVIDSTMEYCRNLGRSITVLRSCSNV